MLDDSVVIAIYAAGDPRAVILANEEQHGMLDTLDFVPPDLLDDMKPLLYPIEDYVSDLMLLPGYRITKSALDVYRKDGVTHLAFLSFDDGTATTIKFGGNAVKLGYILYFCAAHNKYRLLHCVQCAVCITRWLEDMQPEWGMKNAFGGAVQKEGKTYH